MAEQQPMPEQGLCYTAAEDRQALNAQICGEGVIDLASGSLLVTTGGAGLDLFVAAGGAYIRGDDDAPDQGMYRVRNDAQVTVTATAANGSNPRIDQVIAVVADSEYGGISDTFTIEMLDGTPTVGASLSNLNGAATLPDNAIRLAYILVPTSFAGPFVNATHILDYRSSFAECGQDPFIRVEASGVTAIPTGAVTKVDLATTVHNDPAYFSVSASVVTVLQAGTYDVSGHSGFTAGSAGSRGVMIGKNGTTVFVARNQLAPATDYLFTVSANNVVLAANDTLQLAAFQSGDASHNTAAASPTDYLMVRKVG